MRFVFGVGYNDSVTDNVPGRNRRDCVRNSLITIFVILWTLVFHYESTCFFYLNPLFSRDLPKIRFLFPPAGWIMFYHVDNSYAGAEVYGFKNGRPQLIDPHDILTTKAVGYDNIRRNVLSLVLSHHEQKPFCKFLRRKFPHFDNFAVAAVYYPSVTVNPKRKLYRFIYGCP